MDKKYDRSFEILIKMKSKQVFEYFSQRSSYSGFEDKAMLQRFFTKLLAIDPAQTVDHLLKRVDSDAERKRIIGHFIKQINQEKKLRQDQEPSQRENLEKEYERILNKFLLQIFEVNKDLIDEDHIARQFNLLVAHNPDKLMAFMQKTGKWPIDAETICERNGLHVEQAYILLENGKVEQAQEILMRRATAGDIEKCIQLAVKFNFIDKFINNLIMRAS